MQII
jgi:kinesin family protein 2/24